MTDSRRPRCVLCLRPPGHCLCALIPTLQSTTRILVIQHPQEQGHALNTGRLLVAGLAGAQIVVAEHLPLDSCAYAQITDPAWRTELLFPGENAPVLAPAGARDQRPRCLVLIDGTWRKARKIMAINPVLQRLPRVCLPGGLVSRYRLRKTGVPNALSTIEAGVQALHLLEPGADYAAILRPFEALIERQIQAMGPECYARNHSTQGADLWRSAPSDADA
ncbi:tRNA-uridine aminocarboxypropyltransferase [Halopseudomonas sp.]|uniref:tRNA-uridine aminocarboxypropyltransferase n=1 Tax=Halopseudomonas sp. TaxID=2901191 RepID=UPI00356699E3